MRIKSQRVCVSQPWLISPVSVGPCNLVAPLEAALGRLIHYPLAGIPLTSPTETANTDTCITNS